MINRISSRLAYLPILAVMLSLSSANLIRSVWHPARVLFERPHGGQPILLLALFEKGRLRPDIEKLLKAAKQAGIYVIGINSAKLINPNSHEELLDCYIERYNYGRDFGSYRCGFFHIFRNNIHNNTPRVIMANDSVYYSSRGLADFIHLMLHTEIEALGATENHEIHNHLGSFWISMGERVIRNRKFEKFWRRLRLSDVRPIVIFRGEIGLSKCIRRCVSDRSQMRAHFNSSHFLSALRDNEVLDLALKSARTSERTGGKHLDWNCLADMFIKMHMLDPLSHAPDGVTVELHAWPGRRLAPINSFEGFKCFIEEEASAPERLDIDLVRSYLVGKLVEIFVSGSQVHQNAAILVSMGLPFVKLDGLYRGAFSIQYAESICRLIPDPEGKTLRRELMDRPYGGDTLFGWRRLAFLRGLI